MMASSNAIHALAAHADMPTGVFSSGMLAQTDHFPTFLAALQGHSGLDLRYEHAPETRVQVASMKLQQGVNLFGIASNKVQRNFKDGVYSMRETESVILHRAIYSPGSATIARAGLGLYSESMRNYGSGQDGLRALTTVDPLYRMDDEGQCRFTAEVDDLEYFDDIAVPLCGTGSPNYGHFLYDGLPAALMMTSMVDNDRICIVGPPTLAPWQREILVGLNLLRLYRPLPRPTVFRKIVATSLISYHVPFPTRFVRPVFDLLRFRFGGKRQEGRMLLVSRSFDTAKRLMTNRANVEAMFRKAGFEIVYPEQHSVADQVRLFASASIVAGESGAGMANIGFCEPGTKVLEIQPDLFFEGWTRTACMVFGHKWHIFCAASALSEDPDRIRRHGAKALCITADLVALQAAIDAIQLA